MGAYQSIMIVRYVRGVKQSDWPTFNKRFWQRNYYEHVIHNERALQAVRQYIVTNPAAWNEDSLHPQNLKRFNFPK